MLSSPVLVYFPGGEFKYGGKDFYHLDTLPVQLSGQSGLVLVTVNYRLGPLGNPDMVLLIAATITVSI